MDIGRIRRTQQIMMSVRIMVAGNDSRGTVFVEETRTIVVGYRGARIVLQHALNADQEINVRNLGSGVELDMRVVGLVAERPEGYYYVVGFTNTGADIWGIGFPLGPDQDTAIANVYLECTRCQSRKAVGLNEFEVEAFEAQEIISVECDRCADRTLWKRSSVEPGAQTQPAAPPAVKPEAPAAQPPERDGRERRKEKRLLLKMKACVRTELYGNEVVPTENVSKGGFGFKSPHKYSVGMIVEVCVPYSPGAGNIFSVAKIVGLRPLPTEGAFAYGVFYLKGAVARREK
jgi:hypothetical protein